MSTVALMGSASPPRALIDDVSDLGGGTGESILHLPDTATALVFRVTAAGESDLRVIGPRTRASYLSGKDLPVCLQIRLCPGVARLLLGLPVRELMDRTTPLSELWGVSADRLEARLAHLGGDTELILKHLQAAILARIANQTPVDLARGNLVLTAAAALLSARRPAHVSEIARRLAISERHLRNVFTDGVGLPPKRFMRIARVRDVLTSAHARHAQWAQLAVTAGYYDQSHLTADFRAMMGVPPASFFSGRIPAPQPCHDTTAAPA
jgi:AraC-like DNA-binding protein